jgi:hypothetical protein
MVWDKARRELDRWANCGLTARFWVRDDDAIEPSAKLDQLQKLAAKYNIRVGLAIIPGKVLPSLIHYLDVNQKQFYPMCHGWKHVDYGRKNKPAEFGPDRPLSKIISDAESAFQLFSSQFDAVKPIFVPPYNRITPAVARALPNVGFFGVSLMPNFIERKMLQFAPQLAWPNFLKVPARSKSPRIDVHLDMIDWKSNGARATERIVDDLLSNLRGRRLGFLPDATPIGLLTHHLVHNEEIWHACNEALEVLQSHEAVEFIDVGRWADEYAHGN